MNELNIQINTLPNGLRIVTEPVSYVRSAAIGIWIEAGSRNEQDDEAGISHVLEHMLFKGTEKRDAKQIAEEIESLGGYLNAFTDKEMTCYYARVLTEHMPIAVDVLCDMVANSTLTPSDVSTEVGVILEEIKRRDDNPEDLIHDLFLESLWPNHQLGKPVIGTSESVAATTREKLLNYMNRRYSAKHVIVAAAGNFDRDQLNAMVADRLGHLRGDDIPLSASAPTANPTKNLVGKEVEQVHFCIGTQGFAQTDETRFTLAVLDTVLGGTMSSRLFQEIREKRGLVYSIGSYSSAFHEGGYFAVFGGTSPETFEEVQDLTRKEFNRIRTEPLTADELEKAKNHIRGSLVLGLEGMNARMMRLGKNLIYFDRVLPIDYILEQVEKVSADNVLGVADALLRDETINTTAIGPFN